jgi:hypothetical protein
LLRRTLLNAMSQLEKLILQKQKYVKYSKLLSVITVIANTTFRTLYIQFSCTTCFGLFWLSSGRLDNNMNGKEYPGRGIPFISNSVFFSIYVIIKST